MSTFFLAGAVFGFLGVLADVGYQENRSYGQQLLTLGLPTLVAGVLVCGLALVVFLRSRRRS
jgi:hypothetical protein